LKVLLVRLREIGDVVFTTPAVRAIRLRFPDARLAYVVEPAAAPVVAGNPHLDDVIVAAKSGLAADLALGRRLKRERFDLAIDFHGGPRASLLTWLSRAPRRIGYDVPGRAWMYTERVARPRHLRPRHSVVNQWDLLAPLGIDPPSPSANPVDIPVDPAAAAAVDARLAAAGVGPDDRVIVVHVSAGNPFRRWPPAHFAALAAALAAGEPRRRLVFTSGPAERDAEARIAADARQALPADARHRIVSCGGFTLAELRALVDRAALYIGGDSGPLHIAAASRVPIVGLYGPTLPSRSEPWRDPRLVAEAVEVAGLPCRPCDQRVCAPGDFRCLTTLSAEAVAEAAERALARGADAAGGAE
jgi:lipopolysaccharide heptosyltransferase II